jgi:hypothetical protein
VTDGVYLIRPRVRAEQAGSGRDLWVDRVAVQGDSFTVFFCGSATGRGGDGEYRPFWEDFGVISLADMDNPGRSWNPVSRDEDDSSSDPLYTNGFQLTFQGAKPRRFSLASSYQTPAWEFSRVILGNREQ